MEHADLTGMIIGCAMKVHRVLGPGFLESVYQNALAYELRKTAVAVEVGRPLEVRYEGIAVGSFVVDILVEGEVVIENKAVRALAPAHEVQLVNYLTATGIDIGLLFNFGRASLEFRRRSRLLPDNLLPRNPPDPVSPANPVKKAGSSVTEIDLANREKAI